MGVHWDGLTFRKRKLKKIQGKIGKHTRKRRGNVNNNSEGYQKGVNLKC